MTDPRQALATLSAEKPDIVFLDIGMPHIDGYRLAAALKSAEPDLCVVAAASLTTRVDQDRQRGVERRVDERDPDDPSGHALVEDEHPE